jgi:hypothetical protein
MEQVIIGWSQIRRAWGVLQCCHIVLSLEIPDPTYGVMEHCSEV